MQLQIGIVPKILKSKLTQRRICSEFLGNIQSSNKIGEKGTVACFFNGSITLESIVESASRRWKLLSVHLIRNIALSDWCRVYFHNARRDVDNRRRCCVHRVLRRCGLLARVFAYAAILECINSRV